MIRAEQLALVNHKASVENPLNEKLKEIGGTLYPNCYTSAPDTTRGMTALWSGLPPKQNGCDTRIKWAKHFLPEDTETIFDEFVKHNYKIDVFHEPEERKVGLFPPGLYQKAKFNESYDLQKYVDELELEDNHLVFLGVSDFHLSYNDSGYTNEGAKKSFEIVTKAVDIVFNTLGKDEFDHMFIFSDHGFAFSDEVLNPYNYVSNIRSNILMIHREKNQKGIAVNDKFCSIMSVLPTIDEIFGVSKNRYDFSLLSKETREYITIEDHFNYQPRINHNIDLWGLIFKEKIYSRTVEQGYLLDSDDFNSFDKINNETYDHILKNETDFGVYLKEYEMLVEHKQWMQKESSGTISHLSTNQKRIRTKSIFKKIRERLKSIKCCIFPPKSKGKLGFKDVLKAD